MTITTKRLVLVTPDEINETTLCEYLVRNRDFLGRYNPEREEAFYSEAYQKEILEQQRGAWREKTACRYYIFAKEDPEKMIGCVALNTILMGAFCSCFLGYQLDAAQVRKGYTTEAVERVVRFAFEELGLHRIEANIMPDNVASQKVAEKCGFVYEGTSKKLLKIKGRWEDHLRYVRLNEEME